MQCVNALKEATFISTLFKKVFEKNRVCVNALKGATFISTRRSLYQHTEKSTVCQCPEWGDLHFYPCLWKPL